MNHHVEESEYFKVIFGWSNSLILMNHLLWPADKVSFLTRVGEWEKQEGMLLYVCVYVRECVCVRVDLSSRPFACTPVSLCAWLCSRLISGCFQLFLSRRPQVVWRKFANIYKMESFAIKSAYSKLQKASDDCLLFLSVVQLVSCSHKRTDTFWGVIHSGASVKRASLLFKPSWILDVYFLIDCIISHPVFLFKPKCWVTDSVSQFRSSFGIDTVSLYGTLK